MSRSIIIWAVISERARELKLSSLMTSVERSRELRKAGFPRVRKSRIPTVRKAECARGSNYCGRVPDEGRSLRDSTRILE